MSHFSGAYNLEVPRFLENLWSLDIHVHNPVRSNYQRTVGLAGPALDRLTQSGPALMRDSRISNS